DFHPFGEEILTTHRHPDHGYTPDDVRQKFTGYERDEETDLDFAQARSHNFEIGRFTVPDPFNIIFEREVGRNKRERKHIFIRYLTQAQNWNRYVYVLNNPVNLTDPDG